MILTETEAISKFCPYTTSINTGKFCRGSLCMAWRWSNILFPDSPSRPGYCGLAGKPEAAD